MKSILNRKSFMLILLTVALGFSGFAQYDTASYEVTFETYNNNMWKDVGYNLDFRKTLFDESWYQRKSADYIETILGSDFGAAFSARSSGNIRMEYFFEDLTIGTIDTVTYPVVIEFVTPQAGSFNAGEKITITSSFQVQPGAKVVTTYPNSGKTGFDFHIDMNNHVNLEACFFKCGDVSFSPSFSQDKTILQLSTVPGQTCYPGTNEFAPIPSFACYDPPTASIPGIIYEDILPIEIVRDESSISDDDTNKRVSPFFEATLDLPYVDELNTTIQSSSLIRTTGEDLYIESSFDVIGTLFSHVEPYKLNDELTLPYVGCVAALHYDFFNTDIIFDVTNKQEFTFDAKLTAELHLPVEVEYQVKRPPGIVVATGRDSVITYRIGDQLEFIFPCEFEFLDLKPIFKIDNTFRNHTYDEYDLGVDLRALTFKLAFEKVTLIEAYEIEICFPLVDCETIEIPEVAFDIKDVGIGPIWDQTIGPFTLNKTWFDETWKLNGFTDLVDEPFRVRPEPFVVDLAPNSIFCEGDSTGSIILSERGATHPLTYRWSTGALTRNLDDVSAGDYYVKVTDKNRCTAYQGTTIYEPDSLTLHVTHDNCLCYGDATGAIYAEAGGGIPPYDYQWSNGVTTANNLDVTAGTYILIVTDQNGCTISDTVTVKEPPQLISYVNDYRMPLCNGHNDGSIKLNVTGGTEPYRYQWSNFMVTQNVDSLLAGTYTVTVNDDNGCITTSSVTIPEPPKLEGELYVEKPISCYNGADGVIAIDLVGGSPPYRIDWYSPEFTIYQRTPKITNLHEGLYQIEVIDSNDCYLKDTLYLDSPESPFYTDIETKNPDCSYSADGNLQVTVHNGTSPYSYQWSHGAQSKNVFGLTAGKYDVTVTDHLGCETYNNAILVAPDELEAYTNIKKVSCLQEQDGSIKLIPYGGTPPYEVAWSTGQTGQFIDQLATGFYDATVTDANECLKNITLEMLVKGVGCIDIPSAFTPNGDGMNDKWIIRHLNLYPDHSIKVFTKWGSLIYKAAGNGHERPWDGTYNGNNMPAATYYYIVDLGNNEPLRKGLVTIVR